MARGPDEVKSSLTPPAGTKAQLRRWALAQRSSVELDVASGGLRAVLRDWLLARPPTTVVCYRAMTGELTLDALVTDDALAARHRWATTRTPSSGPLTVHPWDAPLERHRFGFEQPVADAPGVELSEIGVVLAPGLLFDARGGRLGYGAGYYDALLAQVPAACAVGVTCEALLVERVPMEAHDVAMSWIATERGVAPAAM